MKTVKVNWAPIWIRDSGRAGDSSRDTFEKKKRVLHFSCIRASWIRFRPTNWVGPKKGCNQGQKMTQSFEDQMLHFMSQNKRILNLHEKKFSYFENFQVNTTMFQTSTNASLKNLEIKIGQLDQAVQKEPKDSFPSDTRKNLKDYMAVILRSGRALDERRVERGTLRKRNK